MTEDKEKRQPEEAAENEEIKKEEPAEKAEKAEDKKPEEGRKEEKKSSKKSSKKPDKAAQLEAELAEQKDRYLRLAAEYDNYRKRSQREKEKVGGDTKAYVLSEILPVIDNFERAANNSSADFEAYRKGIEMTFEQMTAIIAKLGAEPFGEVGDKFDPNAYSAVMHIESDELGENEVAQVFSKGYKLGDRIIRFAVVQVAN